MRRMLLTTALLPAFFALGGPALADPIAPPVMSEIVTSTAENFRSFPGVIRATREVSLAFLATGRMESRAVALGDQVEAGAVIATLDQTSLADDAAAARAAERAATAQAEIAAQAFARAEALHQRGVAPMSQLEAARAAMQTSAAAAEAARATVTRAEDAATYAQLTAPEAGIIIATHADPGDTLQAGQAVATLALLQGREAVIDVPASYLPLFTPETRFAISSRTGDQAPELGQLRVIEPVADRGARMHRMRISLDQTELRLGALVQVRLQAQGDKLLTLPPAAILRGSATASEGASGTDASTEAPTNSGGGNAPSITGTVWRITPERKLDPTTVTLGPEIDGRVIILGGLSEGDEVLIRGINTAKAGQIVGERIVK